MNIQFKKDLAEAQKKSIIALSEKPLYMWTERDASNWRYATDSPIPGILTYYKQGDPRWANDRIGLSWLKMKDYGCAATCLAMMATYTGAGYSPKDVAKQKNWFIGGLIWWDKINVPHLKFIRREYGYKRDNIVSCIKDDPNTFVMVQIKNKQIKEHWMWAIGVNGISFWVADPLTGKKEDLVKKYGNSITGAAYFRKI